MTDIIRTVGHGTATASDFAEIVAGAGIATVVDVRRFPGSRRHPHFGKEEMAQWMPEAGIACRWSRRVRRRAGLIAGRRRNEVGQGQRSTKATKSDANRTGSSHRGVCPAPG